MSETRVCPANAVAVPVNGFVAGAKLLPESKPKTAICRGCPGDGSAVSGCESPSCVVRVLSGIRASGLSDPEVNIGYRGEEPHLAGPATTRKGVATPGSLSPNTIEQDSRHVLSPAGCPLPDQEVLSSVGSRSSRRRWPSSPLSCPLPGLLRCRRSGTATLSARPGMTRLTGTPGSLAPVTAAQSTRAALGSPRRRGDGGPGRSGCSAGTRMRMTRPAGCRHGSPSGDSPMRASGAACGRSEAAA